MSFSKESEVGSSWFEVQNFTSCIVQFKAHLLKHGAHVVLERPRPSDLDVQGNHLIPVNAQQCRALLTS